MKKTVKSNPLKTFNDNKALAVKKMGGVQASFKKKLPKAQTGTFVKAPIVKVPKGPATKTWNVGDPTPSGQFVKTPQDVERLNAMERQKGYAAERQKILATGSNLKTGGATKATKFAALAPPFNKATFADRIVGAKKNKKK
jgi:hypothetical protein